MKKILLLILFVALNIHSSFAQNSRHVIFFTDKNNSPYSISNPLAFLSQRSIDRRNNQGILVTNQDLPVNPAYVSGVAATGATILTRSKWWNSVTVEVTGPSMLNAILALPYVANETNVGRHSVSSHPLSEKLHVEKISTPSTVISNPTTI